MLLSDSYAGSLIQRTDEIVQPSGAPPEAGWYPCCQDWSPESANLRKSHFLTVADVNRSAEFYVRIFGGTLVRSGEPSIIQLANSWLIVNVGGGPTDDKPTVTLRPPQNPNEVSSFLNIRVADIRACYEEWRSRGAEFLTEPKEHIAEIRCYMRDPDGYLIEVGQTTARQG